MSHLCEVSTKRFTKTNVSVSTTTLDQSFVLPNVRTAKNKKRSSARTPTSCREDLGKLVCCYHSRALQSENRKVSVQKSFVEFLRPNTHRLNVLQHEVFSKSAALDLESRLKVKAFDDQVPLSIVDFINVKIDMVSTNGRSQIFRSLSCLL